MEMLEAEKAKDELLKTHHSFSLMVNDYSLPPTAKGDSICTEIPELPTEILNLDDTDIKTFHDHGAQTDVDPVYGECEQLRRDLEKCKKDLESARFNADKIKDDDEKTKFYTALPLFEAQGRANDVLDWSCKNSSSGEDKSKF